MHEVDKTQSEEGARVPGEDRNDAKHEVEEDCRRSKNEDPCGFLRNKIQKIDQHSRCSFQRESVQTDLLKPLAFHTPVGPPARLLKRLLVSRQTLQLLRHVPRRLSAVVLDLQVGACVDETPDRDFVALDDGPVERRQARGVPICYGGPVSEKKINRDGVACGEETCSSQSGVGMKGVWGCAYLGKRPT